MKAKKTGIALAVLGLTVGFAAVTTTLYINGTATITSNKDDFKENVVFTAASIDATSIQEGATQASFTDTEVTFSTYAFDALDDKTTLSFTITNNSTYEAKFGNSAIVCTSDDTSYAEYLTVTPGTELNGQTIERGDSIDGTVEVSLKKSYTGDEDKEITFTCEIDAEALEAADTK